MDAVPDELTRDVEFLGRLPAGRGRILLERLRWQGLLDSVGAEGLDKAYFGSTLDANRTAFACKPTLDVGPNVHLTMAGIGHACHKGLKREHPIPNQDAWGALRVHGDFSVYGVFDGHGPCGHEVAEFVKQELLRQVLQDARFASEERSALLAEVLADAFPKVHRMAGANRDFDALRSGSSATVVVHDHVQRSLRCAWVADSSAVLGSWQRSGNGKRLEARLLTKTHKPNLAQEKKRIEMSGGRVYFDGYRNHRVVTQGGRMPGLNMSRSLGDLLAHKDCGLISTPDFLEVELNDGDFALILCSDGVWEFLEPSEAVEIVARFPPSKARRAATVLAREAWDRWISEDCKAVDDITVVVVYLQHSEQEIATSDATQLAT